MGELLRAARGLAVPEGDGGGGAMRVFHADAAGFHAADGPGAAHQVVELIFAELLTGARGHHLLRQDVERIAGNFETVERAAVDGAHQRRALDELVASGGEEAAFGKRTYPVSGAPHALQS